MRRRIRWGWVFGALASLALGWPAVIAAGTYSCATADAGGSSCDGATGASITVVAVLVIFSSLAVYCLYRAFRRVRPA